MVTLCTVRGPRQRGAHRCALYLVAATMHATCLAEPTHEPLTTSMLALPPCVDFDVEIDGSWRADANVSRRVALEECPLIASQYACGTIGLQHGRYAQMLTFVPRQCHLRPFCASEFAKVIRGRRVVVVGDSHARQLYTSLACKLWKAGAVRRLVPVAQCSHNCTKYGLPQQDRILCGGKGCVGPSQPEQSDSRMQAGPLGGVDLEIMGGGSLLSREGVAASEAGRLDSDGSSNYYQRVLANIDAELHLEQNDILLLSDIGGRHIRTPRVVSAIADSLVGALATGPGSVPHVAWVDGMAPHFAGRPDGEFHRGTSSCPASDRYRHAPTPFQDDDRPPTQLLQGTQCRAHTCDARGAVSYLTVPKLLAACVPMIRSFHATRRVPLAHSGISYTKYARWTLPDCGHVCSPSGPEELRTALWYNMLVSGALFNATARRRSLGKCSMAPRVPRRASGGAPVAPVPPHSLRASPRLVEHGHKHVKVQGQAHAHTRSCTRVHGVFPPGCTPSTHTLPQPRAANSKPGKVALRWQPLW